jgi:CheY-like chemotaxis protein
MKRILLVDDDSAVRALLRFWLEDAGFEVLEAANGGEALADLKKADLLLTDIIMPEKEGVELIREARRSRPALPIIAMSGSSFAESYLTIAGHLGADCKLEKPIRSNCLLATVKAVLEGHPT